MCTGGGSDGGYWVRKQRFKIKMCEGGGVKSKWISEEKTTWMQH